ncbi:MAG: hypothetical protein IPH31_20190 [Lewinellaceae bacterium]|nr:hypothetical protein [Lewinellaceae bacterium]
MRLLTLILLLFTSVALWAQPKFNSPYSRYGIGDIVSPYFANQAGWGGQTAAFHDPFHLNLANPASFAYLRSTALETGIFTKYSKYQAGNATQEEWSGNLSHLALGFTLKSPINEVLDKEKSPWNYAMGIALTPYSRVGYNILTRDTLEDLEDVQNSYQGSGGLYRIAWTGAAKYKNTAFGLNLGWVFGKTSYENTTLFYDTSSTKLPAFQNNNRQDISANGFVWNLGVQHDFVLEHAETDKDIPTRWITVGLAGNGKHNLRASEDKFQIRSRGQLINGTFSDADTLTALTNQRRKMTLPATFSLGVQYVKANKLKLGAQIGLETWSGYENEARPDVFRNTFSVSGGAEFIPDYSSYNKFLKRMRYRVGAYYRQDPRSVEDQDLNDIGFTLGMGFPIVMPRQQTSFVNLAFEVGKLGTDSPIEETYVRFTAGFTLNDNTWFYKRRFE